jgi:hypothetical protein
MVTVTLLGSRFSVRVQVRFPVLGSGSVFGVRLRYLELRTLNRESRTANDEREP